MAIAVALVVSAPSIAGAQSTDTWTGTTANWSTGGWTGGNNPPANGDSLIFGSEGSGGTTLNDDLSGLSLANITFNSAPAYIIGGDQFTLTGGVNNNGFSLETFNNAIVLSGANTMTTSFGGGNLTFGGVLSDVAGTPGSIATGGSGTLTLSGANTYTGGTTLNGGTLALGNAAALGTGALTIAGGSLDNASGSALTLSTNNTQNWNSSFAFTGTNSLNLGTGAVTLGAADYVTLGANTLTVGGVISGVAANTLTLNGTGELSLTGANTFAGGLTLQGATLGLGNAAALGTGTFTIQGGAIDNTSGAALTIANAETWNSNFTFVGTNSLTLSGAIALNGTETVTNANTSHALSLTGVVSGAGGMEFTGPGTVNISGADTFTGGVTMQGGLLNIGSATALGANTSALTISSANSVPVSIDNTSGAALTIGNSQNWQSNFTFVGTNNLTVSGAVSLNGTVDLTVAAKTLTVSGVMSGYGQFTPSGPGTMTLSGANTYGGTTTLTSGSPLNLNNATALGTSNFIINGGTFDNTSGAAITFGNYNSQNWNSSFTFNGSNSLNTGSGEVTLGITPTVTVAANTLTIGGEITDNSLGYGLTKAGAGALVLSGVGAYGGVSTVNAGTLEFTTESSLYNNVNTNWTASNIVVNSGATLALGVGTGQFTASDVQTISAIGSATGGFLGGSYLGLDTSAGAFVYGNVIADTNGGANSLGLVKLGANELTLSGANTYSGGTILNAGTLGIGNATALGAGPLTISGGTSIDNTSGAALTLANNNAQVWNGNFTYLGTNALNMGTGAVTLGANVTIAVNGNTLTEGGAISGAYGLTFINGGTIVLSGANTYTGGTVMNVGNLSISADNNLGAAPATAATNLTLTGGTLDATGTFTLAATRNVLLNENAPINVSNGNTLTIAGVIGDGGKGYGVTAEGSGGTLVLAGANTYSGVNTVQGGSTLSISADNNLGAVPVAAKTDIQLNGGTLEATSSFTLSANRQIYMTNTGGNAINVTSGNTLTYGGSIAAVGNNQILQVSGAGTLDLTGVSNLGNTHLYFGAGTTIIDSGAAVTTTSSYNDMLNNTTGGTSAALTVQGTGSFTSYQSTAGTYDFILVDNGQAGTGTLNISGAATFSVGDLYLAKGNASAIGIVNQSGGTVSTINLQFGNTGATSTYNLTGGVLQTPAITVGSGASAFNLNGGTIQATGPLNWANAGSMTASIGAAGATVNPGGYAVTIGQNLTSGVVSGSDGGLTVAGTGSLTLSGADTYNGPTTVSSGTLALAQGGSLATSAVSVASGATLQIDGASASSAYSLASGSLTVNGGLTFADQSGARHGAEHIGPHLRRRQLAHAECLGLGRRFDHKLGRIDARRRHDDQSYRLGTGPRLL